MKAQNRCGLFALLFALSLTVSSFAYSSNASAGNTLQTCDVPVTLFEDFGERLPNMGNLLIDDINNSEDLETHQYGGACTPWNNGYMLWVSSQANSYTYFDKFSNDPYPYIIGDKVKLFYNSDGIYTHSGSGSVSNDAYYLDDQQVNTGAQIYLYNWSNVTIKTSSFTDAGIIIPQPYNTPDLTEQISIGYEVTDKHMKLWDTTAQPPLVPSTMPCYWFIGINDPTHGAITFEERITDCSTVIEWDFSTYTDYTVVHSILYDKDNDGVITYEEEIARMQITLNLDGSTYNGGAGYNWMHDSRDPVDCSGAGNFMLIAKCEFDNRLNFGLINPSLITVRNLFNSLMVPNDPQCSLVLNNVNLPGNTSFQLNNLVPTACEKSAQFRQMIPLITVALNGVMAFSLLYLIVRIINTLTNRRQNDLFVDLQDRGK